MTLSKKWHMWLPHVNPTVVKTVQAAGYSLVRVRVVISEH